MNKKHSLMGIIITLIILIFLFYPKNTIPLPSSPDGFPKDSYFEFKNNKGPDSNNTNGTQQVSCDYNEKANRDGDHCYSDCGEGKCCDYKEGSEKECVCKENKNPCGDGINEEGEYSEEENNKCAACMAYAEAGGITIPDGCMAAVICTLDNRVDNPEYHPRPKNRCDAVAQGDGKQYNPYKCVCDSKDPNQKFCKCCSGELEGAEQEEYEEALSLAGRVICSEFSATHFNNKGMDSWAKNNCRKLPDPKVCGGVFDFYDCVDK